MYITNPKELKSFIQNDIVKKIKKVRGKHAPISENVNGISKTLKVKRIYDLSKNFRNFFLVNVENYSKKPKLRYFLAISLAHNSSDLLVQLARNFAIENDLKLIQYSVFPKTFRIQLLLLKEIREVADYRDSIEKLKSFRKQFRYKLEKIKNLVENE